jgi:outer membrane protein TolC
MEEHKNRGFGKITIAVCAAVLCAGSTVVRAEQTPHALTLDEALALGRKANRSLVTERARLAQAQANLDLAWTTLFPTVVAQGKYTRNNIEFTFPSDTGQIVIQPKN